MAERNNFRQAVIVQIQVCKLKRLYMNCFSTKATYRIYLEQPARATQCAARLFRADREFTIGYTTGMPETIGIYGGTFDPPHLGHLVLAAEALPQFRLTRLLWVLSPEPPHKTDRTLTPLPQRLEMLRRAIADNPDFELSTVEIDRTGPHYMLDTLHLLGNQFPTAELVLLIGADSLRDLPGWHRPQEILSACHSLGVMRRPNTALEIDTLERSLPGLRAKLRFMEAPLLEISSRTIRSRIAKGGPYRYYLPASVYQYIEQEKLYR